MKVAVIVTTYNRPAALAAVLDGYRAQSTQDFALLVADDGSADETQRVVADFAARAPFPVAHVWQEDRGFRAAAARNRAIAASTADYLVFTDGDCVPSRGFVAAHRALAEPGWFVAGNRMLLSAALTHRVEAAGLALQAWGAGRWLAAWLARDINRLLPLFTLADGAWRKRTPQRWQGVKTCNLGAWRCDLVRVNGLDEAYAGWGLEDSDLVVRLLRAGVRHKNGRFAAPLFHLWHRENDRSRLASNEARLQLALRSEHIEAELGLDRYEPAGHRASC